MSELRILHLPIKRKWFDMIKAGEKPEEYRKIKDYWARRLLESKHGVEAGVWEEMLHDMQNPFFSHTDIEELLNYFEVSFREYDAVRFKNGYRKDSPVFAREFKGLEIVQGREKWGAEPGKYYFSIRLGKLLIDAS